MKKVFIQAPTIILSIVAICYATLQVNAVDSYYASNKDIPHWVSDEQRLYIEKQSYRPAISKEQFTKMGKDALKRDNVKKLLGNPFSQAFVSIGHAMVNDDLEYSYKFVKPGETAEEQSAREAEEGKKSFKVGLENITGIGDKAEFKATYTVENEAEQSVWGVEAKATGSESTVKMNWGWKF